MSTANRLVEFGPPVCPACLEQPSDPRTLTCGHEICLSCLGGRPDNEDNHGNQTGVTCPACSAVTRHKPGHDVTDLPRATLLHPLIQSARNIVQGLDSMITRRCQGKHSPCSHGNPNSQDEGQTSSSETLNGCGHGNGRMDIRSAPLLPSTISSHGDGLNTSLMRDGIRSCGDLNLMPDLRGAEERQTQSVSDLSPDTGPRAVAMEAQHLGSSGTLVGCDSAESFTISSISSQTIDLPDSETLSPGSSESRVNSACSFSVISSIHGTTSSTGDTVSGPAAVSSVGDLRQFSDMSSMYNLSSTTGLSVSELASKELSLSKYSGMSSFGSGLSVVQCGNTPIATAYCTPCSRAFCDVCAGDHLMFTGGRHVLVTLTAALFCPAHSHKHVTSYCQDCNTGVCQKCIQGDHGHHSVVPVRDAAPRARLRLERFLLQMNQLAEESSIIHGVLSKRLTDLNLAQADATDTIESTLDTMSSLSACLKKLQAEVKERVSTQSFAIISWGEELHSLLELRPSLVEHTQSLLAKASDHELLMTAGMLEFDNLSDLKPPGVWLPRVTEPLRGVKGMVKEMAGLCDVTYTWNRSNKARAPAPPRQLSTQPPLTSLICTQTYEFHGAPVCGLTFDSVSCRLVIRTNDKNLPIKFYNKAGRLANQISGGIGGTGDVAFDSLRQWVLAPNEDKLVVTDTEGFVQDVIKLKGTKLRGVAYCHSNDIYVTTDITNNKIILVDPGSGREVRSWGSGNGGPGQFNRPYHVCVGEVGGKDSVIVSDWGKHCVRVFDLLGNPWAEFKGQVDDLTYPWGLGVDPAGTVLVADRFNQRILCYHSSVDGGHGNQLILEAPLCGYPQHIAVDTVSRCLAVAVSKHEFGEATQVQLYKEDPSKRL